MYAPGVEGLLQPLQPWLTDHKVSEILINRPQEVWVERQGVMTPHRVDVLHEAYLRQLFQLIANENRQHLSSRHPLLSGSLPDGSRVQCCLPPTSRHPTMAIRRQVLTSLTLDDYQRMGFYDQAFASETDGESHHPNTDKLRAVYRAQRWSDFIELAIQMKKKYRHLRRHLEW